MKQGKVCTVNSKKEVCMDRQRERKSERSINLDEVADQCIHKVKGFSCHDLGTLPTRTIIMMLF